MVNYHALLVLLLSLPFSASSGDHHAAARVRLNRPFFTRAGAMTKRIIDHLLPSVHIPDVNESASKCFSLIVQNATVSHLDFPKTKFSISERGVDWNSAGGSITVTLQYSYQFLPFHNAGLANVTFEDLRTNVSATIKSRYSRPHFNVTLCDARLGKGAIEIEHTDVVTSILGDYLIKLARSALKINMCLFANMMGDLSNEFVEAQPEDIRLYRNIYLNYTADADPVFNDDYVETTCTFRADLIGRYDDPVKNSTDDQESLELNLARKFAFSMNKSPVWIKYKADRAVINRNAFIRLIGVCLMELPFWLPIFYLPWKLWWILTNRKQKEETTQLISTQENVPMETFSQSYRHID